MHQVDIVPHQFGKGSHFLGHKRTEMDEELQVEAGQVLAGIAGAGGVDHHQFQRFAKGRIRGFDHIQQALSLQETTGGGI